MIAALGLCFLAGIFRYASQPLTPCFGPSDLAYYNLPSDKAFDRAAPTVTVVGRISDYPLIEDTRQRIRVRATQLRSDGQSADIDGSLRLSTGIQRRYRYGQTVRLYGRLVTPPDFEDFSYREYLARRGVHSLFYPQTIEVLAAQSRGIGIMSSLFRFRASGESLLNRLLPEPYAALANGMLLGIEAGIPDQLYEQFNLTGTSHTIVISGSNVALLSFMLLAIGQRLLGTRRALWPTLAGIGCYALLVGGDAAVMRAALMGGLFVIATTLERRSTALVSLATACWVMTLANPLTLWDVGFQLSSAATAGLILFSPGVTSLFSRVWPGFTGGVLTGVETGSVTERARGMAYGLVQDGLLVTIAANITTLPLVLFYFGRLSIASFLTNLLIAPVQPYIMLWGSAGIIVGTAGLTWIAWLVLMIPWFCLAWTVYMVQWTSALPGASVEITRYGVIALTLTYAIIFGLRWRHAISQMIQTTWQRISGEWSNAVVRPAVAGLLGVGMFVSTSVAGSLPDGRLHVWFLDIGQGDGILIQTPSGRRVLIDGGESPQRLFSELGDVMPFWDRDIDMLILSHPDGDHMLAQIEVPKRFDVTTALDTAVSQANSDAAPWRQSMSNMGVDVLIYHAGGWIDLGDGVALWVLWPPAKGIVTDDIDNENSLVVKLVYGDFNVLLTGDAGRPSEAEWLAAGLPLTSSVLKVGHHGSTSSTGQQFVATVNPGIAVIQLGADNRYGHPHPEVLDALDGRTVLRNDLHGRIHISSNGKQMWVETERD